MPGRAGRNFGPDRPGIWRSGYCRSVSELTDRMNQETEPQAEPSGAKPYISISEVPLVQM
jgi:hypothetical protein